MANAYLRIVSSPIFLWWLSVTAKQTFKDLPKQEAIDSQLAFRQFVRPPCHFQRILTPNAPAASEIDAWLNAPTPIAIELQRPLANGKLQDVARGARQDA
jgi:hypothetical protein